MKTYFHPEDLKYTGPELRPHFLLSEFKQEGSCLAAFCGECAVSTDALVDWEDRMNSDHIASKRMLHFLGEFFECTLSEGIWIQRLIVSKIASDLRLNRVPVERLGDDLYVINPKTEERRKLSVSIVTVSPVSTLFHLGLNIDPEGAPVPAVGLRELNVDATAFANRILEWFENEWKSVQQARVKVRPVF